MVGTLTCPKHLVKHAFQLLRLLSYSQAILPLLVLSATLAQAHPNPDTWDLDPAVQNSLRIQPVREDAISRDGIRLALKHFPRPGAQPILLIHGLAQNDRGWDSPVKRYSFARFMHAQGFDVWAGNFRGAGTQGFRSEMPEGPRHWNIDDYAAKDLPALVDAVVRSTGQKPFVIGHSLAAWAIEGYLAGIDYDSHGRIAPRRHRAADIQGGIRGVVTIAGVYNMRWEKPVSEAIDNPIRTIVDYYHSNYELELLAGIRPLYHIVPHLPALPLGWIGDALFMPLHKIPFVGRKLQALYEGFQSEVIGTPVLSMFLYSPNADHEMVRQHGRDGLEDFGPRVIEQLANAVNDKRTSGYYHIDPPEALYQYAAVRDHVDLPILFVAGGRDRLATSYEIYEDGFLMTQARDKQFMHVEEAGHLDIVTGIHAPSEVMMPIAQWIKKRL